MINNDLAGYSNGNKVAAKATSCTKAAAATTASKATSATSATYSSTANYAKNSAKATSATSATYSSTANYAKNVDVKTMRFTLTFLTDTNGIGSQTFDFSSYINSQYSELYNKKLIGIVEAYSGHACIPITQISISGNIATIGVYFAGGESGPHSGFVTGLFV